MTPFCQWYVLCDHPADGVVAHPILTYVPTCQRCAERHALELIPGTFLADGPDFTFIPEGGHRI